MNERQMLNMGLFSRISILFELVKAIFRLVSLMLKINKYSIITKGHSSLEISAAPPIQKDLLKTINSMNNSKIKIFVVTKDGKLDIEGYYLENTVGEGNNEVENIEIFSVTDNLKPNWFLTGLPLIEFEKLKIAFHNFIEIRSFKLFFVFLGTIYTLFLGSFSELHWGLLLVAIFNFIFRIIANSKKSNDNYVTFYKNVQLFLWPYVLLAIGNALSRFVTINGLPPGTFYALVICMLIWAELKGIIENAELAGFYIPAIFKKIVSKDYNRHDSDCTPPL